MIRNAPQGGAEHPDPSPAGFARIRWSTALAVLTMLATLLLAPVRSHAVDPGIAYPSASETSDNKLGSVLIYNVISSSTVTPQTRNTELSITNHHETESTAFRLYFVEGATGAVTRTRLIFLEPNQVLSMLTSDIAPALEGYAIAIALDDVTGCPTSFNHLSGSAAVKLSTGHHAELAADAVAALYTGTIPGCTSMSTSATLSFDGAQYNRMASTLAVDSYSAAVDGNAGIVVINRIGGDLTTGVPNFGIAYEGAASGGTSFGSGVINNLTPQIRRAAESFLQISNDETGWLSISSGGGIAGAFLNFNPNAASSAGAFNGGHNLHRLALITDSLVVPVIPTTPGSPFPASSEASDNRAGSVLVFPFFTSSASTPNSETAALTLTNTHDTAVDVELFFVSGASGAVNPLTTVMLTLPANSPRSVTASAVAPGFRGYVIAVAVDDPSGCPISFNHLIGDVDVKLNTGHFASLPAVGVAALYTGTVPGCATGDASLRFNGVDYNRLPRGVALDNTASPADGNFTLFVLDHLGGDLESATTSIGTMNGSFYDDSGIATELEFNAPPQFFGTFSPDVPSGVPAWFEIYPASVRAIVGSALKFNANTVSTASAFSGGHNLHALTLATDTLALGGPPVSTATRTSTPTATPTFTRTRTPTVPVSTATHTATRTATRTATATVTRTASTTATRTASTTATRTATMTATRTASTTATRTVTATATRTATTTRTATATVPASVTPTDAGPSATPTPTSTGPPSTSSPSPSPTLPPSGCVGDCSGNGVVAINELIIGVNIALGNSVVGQCPSADANDNGTVAINELIRAVGNALNGCS